MAEIFNLITPFKSRNQRKKSEKKQTKQFSIFFTFSNHYIALISIIFDVEILPYWEQTFRSCCKPALYGQKITKSFVYIRWLTIHPVLHTFNCCDKSSIYTLNGDKNATLVNSITNKKWFWYRITPFHLHGLMSESEYNSYHHYDAT